MTFSRFEKKILSAKNMAANPHSVIKDLIKAIGERPKINLPDWTRPLGDSKIKLKNQAIKKINCASRSQATKLSPLKSQILTFSGQGL